MTMKIEKILLCLDLSSTDELLVRYVAGLQRNLQQSMAITLFHNIRYDFLSAHPEFDGAMVDRLKKKVARELRGKYSPLLEEGNSGALEVIVMAESRTEEAILAQNRREKYDWLVMGKKNEISSSGILPWRILAADESETPMLLIPSDSQSQAINSLMVGLDLARSSGSFLEKVTLLAEQLDARWHALHVFQPPLTYFPFIEQADDAIQRDIRKKAQNRLDELWKSQRNVDSGSVELVQGSDIGRTLLDHAMDKGKDLLVIKRISRPGLLGHRLGGVARHILSQDIELPLLIL